MPNSVFNLVIDNVNASSNSDPVQFWQTHTPPSEISHNTVRCDRLEARLDNFEDRFEEKLQKLQDDLKKLRCVMNTIATICVQKRGRASRFKSNLKFHNASHRRINLNFVTTTRVSAWIHINATSPL